MSESSEVSIPRQKIIEKHGAYVEAVFSENPIEDEVDKKYAETMVACIDALQYSTEGDLWNKACIEVDLPPSSEILPYGSHVSIIPTPLSNEKHWELTSVMTKEINSPKLGAMIQTKGTTADDGSTLVEQINWTCPEINKDHALVAFAQAALSVLNTKEQQS